MRNRTRRRTLNFLPSLAVVLACSGCGATAVRGAELVMSETVAPDFSALAEQTFGDFVAAAPGVAECLGSIRLEAATELEDAAVYSAASRTITIRVPATAPRLQASLIHELSHHIEVACDSHLEIRRPFLAAQDVSPATPWFTAELWEDTPSEQFAEAVVTAVQGGRQRNLGRIRLSPEAVLVVAKYLAEGG